MRALILIACLLALTGCGGERVSIAAPCGVIADSLKDVRGATPADTRRIDIHFERGVAAGCWTR